jgi:hypothetical protein
VRGSTYFLCLRKESRRRKRAHTADWLVGVHPCPQPGTAQDETCRRTPRVSEKAVIRSGVALCAPRSGTTLSACSTGCLRLLGCGFFQNRVARRFPPHLANPPPEINTAFRDKRRHVGQPRCSGAQSAESPLSQADPSATHAVRSGVDERLVTNARAARDGLVPDHSGYTREMDTCRRRGPALFAYFLCGGAVYRK